MGLYRTHEEYLEIREWENRLRALTESLSDRLETAQRDDALEFLAHGESGLLIEFLAYRIGEYGHPLTAAERTELLAVATESGEQVRARVGRDLGEAG
jgi:hypothetical protein